MAMPADFRYKDVFLRGKPRHGKNDTFTARHPVMPVGRRAKIFAPFDALRGFSAAVIAKDVPYECRTEPDREAAAELDRRLRILRGLTSNGRKRAGNPVRVEVTCWFPCEDEDSDAFGTRGQYRTVEGICEGVDPEVMKTVTVDGVTIAFGDILAVESSDGVFGDPDARSLEKW